MPPLSVHLRPLHATRALHRRATLTMLITRLVLTASILTSCSSSGDGGAPSTAGSGQDNSAVPAGPASASLAWDPVAGVLGYIVYYGTQRPGSPGSCAYSQSVFSSTPSATVAGLDADTTYYFAVSSYNGLESACSGEITTTTGSA